MGIIILTPVAERDVAFYLATAKILSQKNWKVLFVSFYEPGNKAIRAAGYEVYNPFSVVSKASREPLSVLEKRYGTPPLKEMILHEKLTFGLASDQEVLHRFEDFLHACDRIFDQIESAYPNGPRRIIQELAGFVGPLSLFYCGMKRGWTHEFLEPSFFKGHIHFLKNSLFLKIPEVLPSAESQQKTAAYLESAQKNKVVVAAAKDAHHYKDMGVGKVLNKMNINNLIKKLYYKYILRQEFLFSHIGNHVLRYLRMLRNRYINDSAYCSLEQIPTDKRWIYFPFHVQLDFSLTIRSPDWLDQLGLIEKALENLPSDILLIAKEHPASIGCLDQGRLERVLADPRFRLLRPTVNSHDVLEKCCGVLTINSKVGAEALSMGLPILSFGKAFYTDTQFTQRFTSWNKLKEQTQSWTLAHRKNNPDPAWIYFLSQVWQDSTQCELYDLQADNIENFVDGILQRGPYASPSERPKEL